MMHVFVRPIDRFLACAVCGGLVFQQREVKLAPSGSSIFDKQRPDDNADCAICTRCGHVHPFIGSPLQWLDADKVRAEDLPADPLA